MQTCPPISLWSFWRHLPPTESCSLFHSRLKKLQRCHLDLGLHKILLFIIDKQRSVIQELGTARIALEKTMLARRRYCSSMTCRASYAMQFSASSHIEGLHVHKLCLTCRKHFSCVWQFDGPARPAPEPFDAGDLAAKELLSLTFRY